jgi:GT2 family glycosyltransferase
MQFDVSIIIVNYNTHQHLKKCLDSIKKYTARISYEIIVVDNNSTDREIEKFAGSFKNTNFYFKETNDGFGAGCNYGVTKANGKYFVFINPDVELLDNCLCEIFLYMEDNPNVGVSSGLLVYPDNSVQYSYNYFPDFRWHLYEVIGWGASRQINRLMNHPSILKRENNPIEADWLMGAFLFIRKDAFTRVNGFDEDIFLYMEDIDIQLRIKNLGYSIKLLPHISVVHGVRSSVRSFEGENLFYFHSHRSKMIYMYKHYNFFKRNLLRILNIVGITFRILTLPFRIKFINKKKQKLTQYVFMIKFYLINKTRVVRSTYEISPIEGKKKQIKAVYDDFWESTLKN